MRVLRPNASFEITSNHLYQIILNKLSAKDLESEIEFQVLKAYQQARFLFKRTLVEESLQLIKFSNLLQIELVLQSHYITFYTFHFAKHLIGFIHLKLFR